VLAADGRQRGEGDVTIKDGLVIGLVQCASLVPGVSRSGATISAGIARGINRVVATELSFFLAIPALTAAGIFEAVGERTHMAALGVPQMAVGIVVSFVVAYASIAWLLKFVSTNSLRAFISYRVVLGAAIFVALAAGWLSST
jgi:undecaprenyl-diphosphatase